MSDPIFSQHDEFTPLLHPEKRRMTYYSCNRDKLNVPAKVKRLRYVEIPRAVNAGNEAMANDSFQRYLDDADPRGRYEPSRTFGNGVHFWDSVYHGRAFTIDNGDAAITFTVPGQSNGPLVPLFLPLIGKLQPAEYQKRVKETADALRTIYKSAFGDRIKDMIEIATLATAPEKQGRGYGTALVQIVHEMADAQGRAIFLFTSDAYGFYDAVGYKMVGEALLGADNPKWHGGPVYIRVMLREPMSLSRQQCAKDASLAPSVHSLAV
ncbi:hypothetical protein C8Q80DRAFT_1271804 [Daedaleopsis nitida]|nr:hypothetical protein C8Q80DRAFT_1271804 [Daedaleopsis nitida]